MTKWTKLCHCWCFQPRFLQRGEKKKPEYQHESVLHFGEKSYDIHHTPRINGEDGSVAMALACPESMFCHVLTRKFTNCSRAFTLKATKSRERRSQVLLTLVSHVIKKETKMTRICLKQKKWGEKSIASFISVSKDNLCLSLRIYFWWLCDHLLHSGLKRWAPCG